MKNEVGPLLKCRHLPSGMAFRSMLNTALREKGEETGHRESSKAHRGASRTRTGSSVLIITHPLFLPPQIRLQIEAQLILLGGKRRQDDSLLGGNMAEN